ncbi:PH domain-containing protein, partial [Streptomyces sp. 2MCAF27]
MTDAWEVACRSPWKRTLWYFVGLGAAGAGLAVVRLVFWDGLWDVWPAGGLVLALVGVVSLRGAIARVSADAHGLHTRTLLRRRTVPWGDVADLRIRLKYANTPRVQE